MMRSLAAGLFCLLATVSADVADKNIPAEITLPEDIASMTLDELSALSAAQTAQWPGSSAISVEDVVVDEKALAQALDDLAVIAEELDAAPTVSTKGDEVDFDALREIVESSLTESDAATAKTEKADVEAKVESAAALESKSASEPILSLDAFDKSKSVSDTVKPSVEAVTVDAVDTTKTESASTETSTVSTTTVSTQFVVTAPTTSTASEPTSREAVEIAQAVAVEEARGEQIEAAIQQAAQPETAAAGEMPVADVEGVYPSLVHKGSIKDFFKVLGVGARRNIVLSSAVSGEVTVNLFDVTFYEALDAVTKSHGLTYEEQGPFIYVYTLQEYSELLAATRQRETKVYQMYYISAADVSGLITPLLSEEGEVTVNPEAGGDTVGDTWAGGNYLIVNDYPENHEEIAKIIADMDTRPQQVLVEATIMVARLNDTNELGIDFQVLGGVNFQAESGVVGAVPDGAVDLDGTTTSANTAFTANVTSGGLSVGIVKNNIGLFIEALESTTDVVTLGNPKILTVNRHEGKVIVGNRDGYITTEVSQTTTTQTVEFLETGTQLTFRPFIMNDGFVRMEINPKDSDGGVEVEGNFTLPSESTAEVTTNVLVRDGHTIVIGGLFRERNSIGRSQVPLIGDVPILGNLFRSTSDISNREEVIFLITPHIVKDETDYALGEDVLEESRDRLMGMREGLMPTGRRRLASLHYERALEHQAAGRTEEALWDVDLACQLSPSFLDALHLRDQLRNSGGPVMGTDGSMLELMRRLVEQDEAIEAQTNSTVRDVDPVETASYPTISSY